ncbi:hypothetical protein CCACVL1_24443 [Corchorus capsularis]|uniref:Uncharacterized protein n=1 Tax=Corchorus capsularis TaxID=210143 RepID=A0A1R3GPK5_COCAP|nr:hypothetical protein CCACVL1_24443 [Corchorus capsularis]
MAQVFGLRFPDDGGAIQGGNEGDNANEGGNAGGLEDLD